MDINKTKIVALGNSTAFPVPKKIMGLFGEMGTVFNMEFDVKKGQIILTKEEGKK